MLMIQLRIRFPLFAKLAPFAVLSVYSNRKDKLCKAILTTLFDLNNISTSSLNLPSLIDNINSEELNEPLPSLLLKAQKVRISSVGSKSQKVNKDHCKMLNELVRTY
ncbi:10541_t:CDS:2 [Entrophospora sp. SA101]|nr:11298_t:CDS:2 [Entrophospora sp. SA101]CAJ0852079.1 10541_t:CDS:2 [Entrophospora sp. SA101]